MLRLERTTTDLASDVVRSQFSTLKAVLRSRANYAEHCRRVKCDGKMGNEAGVGAVNCSNCEAAGVQEVRHTRIRQL